MVGVLEGLVLGKLERWSDGFQDGLIIGPSDGKPLGSEIDALDGGML